MIRNVAILNNSIVENIIVVDDSFKLENNMIVYSEHNPAFIGGDYVEGYFYPPQPFPSWIRNNGKWDSPLPYPVDEKNYYWDENLLNWIEVQQNV